MDQKRRNITLAILSAGGIFYIIGRIYGLIIDLIKNNVSLTTLKYIVVTESLFFLIFGLLCWKKIKLNKNFSKYFIIFFIIVLILDLLYKIKIIL